MGGGPPPPHCPPPVLQAPRYWHTKAQKGQHGQAQDWAQNAGLWLLTQHSLYSIPRRIPSCPRSVRLLQKVFALFT